MTSPSTIKASVYERTTGLYIHQCPSCGIEFCGRKNALYCGSKCKARINNERASELRKQKDSPISKRANAYIRNFEILKKYYYAENRSCSMTELIAEGFYPDAPSDLAIDDTSTLFRQYFNFIIEWDSTTGMARIVRKGTRREVEVGCNGKIVS